MSPRIQHGAERTRMIDDGTLSPKVSIPSSLLVLAGAILALLDLTGVIDIPDEIYVTLLGAGGVTFTTGYAARPGPVVPDPVDRDELRARVSERGLTLVEALIVLALVAIAVLAFIVLT